MVCFSALAFTMNMSSGSNLSMMKSRVKGNVFTTNKEGGEF